MNLYRMIYRPWQTQAGMPQGIDTLLGLSQESMVQAATGQAAAAKLRAHKGAGIEVIDCQYVCTIQIS